jgi:hypothetical protein
MLSFISRQSRVLRREVAEPVCTVEDALTRFSGTESLKPRDAPLADGKLLHDLTRK